MLDSWKIGKHLINVQGNLPMARRNENETHDYNSLPEFLDFKLFGKTILVVNRKFELFLAHQLRK